MTRWNGLLVGLILVTATAFGTLESQAGDKEVKYGGRIQTDWTAMKGDDSLDARFGNLEDGTEMRRARIFVSGLLYEAIEFKAQFDFAGGDVDIKDVYMGIRKLPIIGRLRTGHFFEPFGLEQQTSSKYITFLERSLTSAFTPGRNSGIAVDNTFLDKRLTCSFGVFRDTDDYAKSTGDGKYNFTARTTALLMHDEATGNLIHIGGAFSHRNPNGDMLTIKQRPSIHLAPKFVNSGEIATDAVNLFGGEFAAVFGPVPVQAEYVHAVLDAIGGSDRSFGAYYVQIGFFLTGESRPYKSSSGTFNRVKPRSHYIPGEQGAGAWEVAARFSGIDLDDQEINGGRMEDLTIAVNWYLNANTRLMVNYVHAVLKGTGNADALLARMQVDF